MKMVEVFKTNIEDKTTAHAVAADLSEYFPGGSAEHSLADIDCTRCAHLLYLLRSTQAAKRNREPRPTKSSIQKNARTILISRDFGNYFRHIIYPATLLDLLTKKICALPLIKEEIPFVESSRANYLLFNESFQLFTLQSKIIHSLDV